MTINWVGLVVFAGILLALWAAISRPDWMPIAEGIATVLILLALGGFLMPRFRKNRGL